MPNSTSQGGAQGPSSEIDALLGEIKAKKNEFDALISSSTSSIEGSVNKAKAGASQVENLKTEIATAKGAIDTTQQSASVELSKIAQLKADVEKLVGEITAASQSSTNERADLTKKLSALQERLKKLENIVEEIESLKSAAEKESAATKASVQEIEQSKTNFTKLNTDTEAQYATLVQKQTALQKKIAEIEDANTKVTELRRSLLEDSDNQKSVQSEITTLHTQIADLLTEVTNYKNSATSALNALQEKAQQDMAQLESASQKRFDQLHNSLQERILSLLPSAGAAGLASTYYDAKSRYAPTSLSGKHGEAVTGGLLGLVRKAFGYNPASMIATVTFYTMFIGPLVYIAYVSVSLLNRIEADPHFIVDYRMIGIRVLIAIPLVVISGFGFASLRLYRKLFEEYNHKQRVMELYQSFKNEIDKGGDDEQKKRLLTIMLESVGSKAWDSAKDAADEKPESLGGLSLLERAIDDLAKLKTIGTK